VRSFQIAGDHIRIDCGRNGQLLPCTWAELQEARCDKRVLRMCDKPLGAPFVEVRRQEVSGIKKVRERALTLPHASIPKISWASVRVNMTNRPLRRICRNPLECFGMNRAVSQKQQLHCGTRLAVDALDGWHQELR